MILEQEPPMAAFDGVRFTQLREAAKSVAASLGVRWVEILAEPAPAEAFRQCEQEIGMALSPEHRRFLKITNGYTMSLIMTETFFDIPSFGVQILSCKEISEETRSDRENFEIKQNLIVIASYSGTGDVCLAQDVGERREYRIVDGFNETPGRWGKHEEDILAESFNEWLTKMFESVTIRHNLLTYWLKGAIADIHDEFSPAPDGQE
jgi:hypothetical protein